MLRSPIIALAAALLTTLCAPAWSQVAQTGTPAANGPGTTAVGTANQAAAAAQTGVPSTPARPGVPSSPASPGFSSGFVGPNTPAATGAGFGAQSATSSGYNRTGAAYGNAVAQRQTYTPGGAAAERFNRVFGNFNTTMYVGPNPWFNDLAIQQQLQLNELQYNQLNQAYQQAWNRYDQAVTSLPANLALAERAAQLQELQNQFNGEFNGSVETALADPQLRERFTQMGVQFQKFNTSRPSQSRAGLGLDLTAEQGRRLRLMANQWVQQMENLRERAAKGQSVTDEDFRDLRAQARQQIAAVLTPTQQQIWQQLVATYYPTRDLFAPAKTSDSPASDSPAADPHAKPPADVPDDQPATAPNLNSPNP